jgi:Ca-activated chloride channel homolog
MTAGERLEAARGALAAFVVRLDPSDPFRVVAFDGTADVIVPAAPVADKEALRHAIAAL